VAIPADDLHIIVLIVVIATLILILPLLTPHITRLVVLV